jgi:NAD(P)-dependent dehydrogenase (short-subunit alcohol dehydrogenase family)
MDLGLQGAKVLVTAASEGLGAATARRFSLEGAQVVISSRSLPNFKKLPHPLLKKVAILCLRMRRICVMLKQYAN